MYVYIYIYITIHILNECEQCSPRFAGFSIPTCSEDAKQIVDRPGQNDIRKKIKKKEKAGHRLQDVVGNSVVFFCSWTSQLEENPGKQFKNQCDWQLAMDNK